jgi:hypothetical protein
LGDKNTCFLHLKASLRRKRNKITNLRKAYGQVTEDIREMGRMTSAFYKNLYTLEGVRGMYRILQIYNAHQSVE